MRLVATSLFAADLGAAANTWLATRKALAIAHVHPETSQSFPPNEIDNSEIWARFILAARDRAAK